MEKLNEKKPLANGKMLDLLTRLIKLRKRSQQTNQKLDELKKQSDELLHSDTKK
ncbi:hypothetical protein [Pedobacter sp. V48]|jgi:hypothetical protein|uniref:hypothetical protein n=1 Tax=Pedobacter sp. V48 TaxID=509635 RepID=UPI0004AF33BB|nr:hypothetical protein [Pedobacter sp. V48]